MCLRDDKEFLVFGGVDADGARLNDLYAFDCSTRIWRELPTNGAPPPGGEDCHLLAREEALYVLVGVDRDEAAFANAAANFEQQGLPPPQPIVAEPEPTGAGVSRPASPRRMQEQPVGPTVQPGPVQAIGSE